LSRVLRVEPGQRFELSDNHSVYLAEVSEAARDWVRFRVLEELEAVEPPLQLTVYASLIKFDRFELLVEKATELGVAALMPVRAERSESGLLEAASKRVERWRRIARESSQQSRRARVPEIGAPTRLADVLDQPPGLRFYLEEEPGAQLLVSLLPPPPTRRRGDLAALALGPEGGWTAAERQGLRAAGWTPAALGPLILRAETAAMAGMVILMQAWWEFASG